LYFGMVDLAEEFVLPVGRNVSDDLKFAKYRFVWMVPYQAGALKGSVIATGDRLPATKSAPRVCLPGSQLAADRSSIRADGEDLSFITVRVEDQDGNLCPLADNLIHFAITGPASIAQ
jgi:beta-galactosidase